MGNVEVKPIIKEVGGSSIPIYRSPNYRLEYNLVPSFVEKSIPILDETNLSRYLGMERRLELPKYMDLRPDLPPVLKCGLGTHSLGVVVSLLHYQLLHQNLPVFPPSRSFIYNNMDFYGEKTPKIYSLMSVFNSILGYGFCSENDCSNLDTPINVNMMEKAEGFRFIQIYRVENRLEIIKQLIAEREPVLVNLSIYYDIGNMTGKLLMPEEKEKPIGGLGFLLVGYLDERQCFIGMTAMGTSYGSSGYVLIPYDYVKEREYCPELFTLRFHRNRVEGYIQQRRQMRQTIDGIETPDEETKKRQDEYKKDASTNIFG
jgi:hypothetical protein